MYKLASFSSLFLATQVDARLPSSLIELSNVAKETIKNVDADSVLGMIQRQVAEFQKSMDAEVAEDKEEVRKLQEQQRKMEREEKAFKAKVFANRASSFSETAGSHFGDPYIDEAMRTIGDDIDAQKRDLERVISSHRQSSLVEEKAIRPDLGVIASALRTRLNMVGK